MTYIPTEPPPVPPIMNESGQPYGYSMAILMVVVLFLAMYALVVGVGDAGGVEKDDSNITQNLNNMGAFMSGLEASGEVTPQQLQQFSTSLTNIFVSDPDNPPLSSMSIYYDGGYWWPMDDGTWTETSTDTPPYSTTITTYGGETVTVDLDTVGASDMQMYMYDIAKGMTDNATLNGDLDDTSIFTDSSNYPGVDSLLTVQGQLQSSYYYDLYPLAIEGGLYVDYSPDYTGSGGDLNDTEAAWVSSMDMTCEDINYEHNNNVSSGDDDELTNTVSAINGAVDQFGSTSTLLMQKAQSGMTVYQAYFSMAQTEQQLSQQENQAIIQASK